MHYTDLRNLIRDHEARVAPESIAYTLRGLNAALADHLADGAPDERRARLRHNEITGALTHCAELYAAALSRYIAAQVDNSAEPEDTPE